MHAPAKPRHQSNMRQQLSYPLAVTRLPHSAVPTLRNSPRMIARTPLQVRAATRFGPVLIFDHGFSIRLRSGAPIHGLKPLLSEINRAPQPNTSTCRPERSEEQRTVQETTQGALVVEGGGSGWMTMFRDQAAHLPIIKALSAIWTIAGRASCSFTISGCLSAVGEHRRLTGRSSFSCPCTGPGRSGHR